MTCPDNSYAVFPILGVVSGGTATSCGNATVTATNASAATLGNGTVPTSFRSTYLGINLSLGLDGKGYTATEGSAVHVASFNVSPGSTISFNWEGVFEEGSTGSLFYVLNGSLSILSQIGAITLQPSNLAGVPGSPERFESGRDLYLTAVLEPATFGLTGVALAGLASYGRRKS